MPSSRLRIAVAGAILFSSCLIKTQLVSVREGEALDRIAVIVWVASLNQVVAVDGTAVQSSKSGMNRLETSSGWHALTLLDSSRASVHLEVLLESGHCYFPRPKAVGTRETINAPIEPLRLMDLTREEADDDLSMDARKNCGR